MQFVWQHSQDRRNVEHAFATQGGTSVCLRKVFKPDRPFSPAPTQGFVCPYCRARLLELLPGEDQRVLPLEFLDKLSLRSLHALRAVRPQAVSIRDILDLTEIEVAAVHGCGLGSLENIREALKELGLSLRGKPIEVRHRIAKAETKQKMFKAQAMRFITAFGLDGIQTLTLQAMAEEVGLTRERVRQIFEGNPALSILRGNGPKTRYDEMTHVAVDRLLEGDSVHRASVKAGLCAATLMSRAKNDPTVADALTKGRRIRKAKRVERFEDRILQVVHYAQERGTSFRQACDDLNENYVVLVGIKNHNAAHLKMNPTYRGILDPGGVILEEVQIARERIIQGSSFNRACKGLHANKNTIRRHLAKDPEIEALIQGRAKKKTAGEELDRALAQAKPLLLGGMCISRVAKTVNLHEMTIQKHLAKDPEVATVLATRRRFRKRHA